MKDASRSESNCSRFATPSPAGTTMTICSAAASRWRAIVSVRGNTSTLLIRCRALWTSFAPIASEWMRDLGQPNEFPADLQSFLQLCHLRGQRRPTPILLRYRAGDFNCLHQDLYGELFFPFQIILSLSRQGKDYEGRELVLVEQRPRAQSTPRVIVPTQGEAILITTRYRPVQGVRGFYRVNIHHGVSTIHSGSRHTLGILFHDAK